MNRLQRVNSTLRVETSLFDRLFLTSRRRVMVSPVDGRLCHRVRPVPPPVLLFGQVNAVVDFLVREIVACPEGLARRVRGILP